MKVKEFNQERKRLTELALDKANLSIKRFYGLDTATYTEGALDAKTKEMLGLVASMVLRCDDCICYHLGQCYSLNVNDEELQEVFGVALMVGGSIVIPHHRRAVEYWEELKTS
ncbi:MAG: carboxymuconolactone decarboxylase family protein [Candidatus Cloacimonetes bacterium]|nr:carboxymuconolactone decarboxylase family protein [Candidatus Cloacimonadota bacterium]